MRLCIAGHFLWEVWNNRNRCIHGEPCTDLYRSIFQWAKVVFPLVPGIIDDAARSILAFLDLKQGDRNARIVSWKRWDPGVGICLNMSVIDVGSEWRGAALFRSKESPFILSYVRNFPKSFFSDEITEFTRFSLCVAKDNNIQVNSIRSSQPGMPDDTISCNFWKLSPDFQSMLAIFKVDRIGRVPCFLNQAANCVVYQVKKDGVVDDIRQLPIAVRRMVWGEANLPFPCLEGEEESYDQERVSTIFNDDHRFRF